MDFHETVMGYRFYEHTMPTIANKLGVIADALTVLAANSQPSPAEDAKKSCTGEHCCCNPNTEFDEEFIGQIVDICENAVDEITGDRETIHFQGKAYDAIAARIKETLRNWGITDPTQNTPSEIELEKAFRQYRHKALSELFGLIIHVKLMTANDDTKAALSSININEAIEEVEKGRGDFNHPSPLDKDDRRLVEEYIERRCN